MSNFKAILNRELRLISANIFDISLLFCYFFLIFFITQLFFQPQAPASGATYPMLEVRADFPLLDSSIDGVSLADVSLEDFSAEGFAKNSVFFHYLAFLFALIFTIILACQNFFTADASSGKLCEYRLMPLLFQFVIIAKMLVFYIFKILPLVIFGIIFVIMLGAGRPQPVLQADYAYVYSVPFLVKLMILLSFCLFALLLFSIFIFISALLTGANNANNASVGGILFIILAVPLILPSIIFTKNLLYKAIIEGGKMADILPDFYIILGLCLLFFPVSVMFSAMMLQEVE